MRILLVEDDEPTQELIAAMIKTVFTNIHIETADNGTYAYTRFLDSFMKRHGDIPCLRKPFDLHQFQEAVQAAFDRCSSRSTVSRKE